MNSIIIGIGLAFLAFIVLIAVWARMRRQVGGGWGPTEFTDGSMTITPTGYPEEMHGRGKKIGPTDNAGT